MVLESLLAFVEVVTGRTLKLHATNWLYLLSTTQSIFSRQLQIASTAITFPKADRKEVEPNFG